MVAKIDIMKRINAKEEAFKRKQPDPFKERVNAAQRSEAVSSMLQLERGLLSHSLKDRIKASLT